jgi:tRNA pseudouridine38-40 synthase
MEPSVLASCLRAFVVQSIAARNPRVDRTIATSRVVFRLASVYLCEVMPEIVRYKMTVAYRGTDYHGWQRQPVPPTWKGATPEEESIGIPTIQAWLDFAIARVVDHPVQVVGSSRTDAGVHAYGQVACFDTDKSQIPLLALRRAINTRLPKDISISSIELAHPQFDPILWTIRKRYEYLIWNTPDRDVFHTDQHFHRYTPIDLDVVREGARQFVGTHDFHAFAKPGHKRATTIRTVHEMDVKQEGPLITVGVVGSGFLWNQVRIMVGTLVDMGQGRFRPDQIPAMLASRDRTTTGSTAPAHGLYLKWIEHHTQPPAEVVVQGDEE